MVALGQAFNGFFGYVLHISAVLTNAIGDEEMSNVFIGCSRKDKDFVNELYRRLARDGVDCFFDKESIAWSANRVVELENGLNKCEAVVLVLSSDFCRSEWPKIESTSAMVDDLAGFRSKLRPLLLKPCGEDLSLFLRARQHIKEGS